MDDLLHSIQEGRFNRPDFFKSLLDHMQIGVIVTDAQGYIIYINTTYARFLNINAQEQIGKHATKVVANTRLHIVAQTGVAEINHPHEFNDIGYLVHRIPIRENDRIIAVLGLVLFEDARTASHLADKLSVLESKVRLYENELAALRSTRYTLMDKRLFRKDLFYRLSVIPLNIPPLRKRRDDIIPMVKHFLAEHKEGRGRPFQIDHVAADCLQSHDWPGNARELQNVIEQILVSLEGSRIQLNHLPFYIRNDNSSSNQSNPVNLKTYLDQAEKAYISKVLEATDQNKSETARRLGIHRTLLYRKMKKLRLVQ